MANTTSSKLAPDRIVDTPPSSPVQITTTIPFVLNLLSLRVALSELVPSSDHMKVRTLIPERDLRALYLKALLWLVDRECVETHGAQVVFVGGAVAEPIAHDCPALSLHAARIIAKELPPDVMDETSELEFDAYMFHGGDYYVSNRQGLSFVITGVLFAACALVYFALDVYKYLVAV